jgi:hypothetical protein
MPATMTNIDENITADGCDLIAGTAISNCRNDGLFRPSMRKFAVLTR